MAETAIAPAPPAPPSAPTPAPTPPPAAPPPPPVAAAPEKVKVADHIKRKFPDFAKVLEDEPVPVAKPLPDPNAPPKPREFPRNLSDVVMDDMKATAEKAAAAAAPPAPEVPPVPATPAAELPATPPPAVKVTPKAPKVDVDKIVTDRIAEALAAQQAAAPPPATPAAPPAAPDPFEASLNEDQKERLEFARDAAKLDPAKYANLPAQTLAFFKAVDTYVQKKSGEEDGHDENSPEFIRFIQQNKPKITDGEIRRIDRQRVVEEAKRSVREESQAELAATQRKITEIELKPKIEAAVKDFSEKSLRFMAEQKDPITAPIFEKAITDGWEKAAEVDPLYGPVIRNIHGKATELSATYMRLVNSPGQFDANNPDHVWLVSFIKNQGENFKANGGDARIRTNENGTKQTFLPVAEFNALRQKDPAKAEQYWSFDDFGVLSRLAGNAAMMIQDYVKKQEETFKRAGYSRQSASPPPAPPATPASQPPPPAPVTSPKTASSVAPGAAQAGKQMSQMEHTMKMLGIKVPVPV